MQRAFRIVRDDKPRRMCYDLFDMKWFWIEDSISGTTYAGDIISSASELTDALELAQLDCPGAYIEETS